MPAPSPAYLHIPEFDMTGWQTPQSYGNNFAPFPKGAGVYVIAAIYLDPSWRCEVLYVGMSTNLKQRMKQHEIKALCEKRYQYIHIYFKKVSKTQLRTREKKLIKKFNPPFNLQHRERGI